MNSNKSRFYWSYFYYKFIAIWFDVKSPKLKFFGVEFFYSLSKFFKPLESIAFSISVDFIETKFGKFYLRPSTMDVICASPAFERLDIDLLFDLFKKFIKQRKKILFLDIGADIGTYSITIGNYFKKYKNIKIIAFEPDKKNYKFLVKNLNLNKLKVKAYNFAFSNKNASAYINHNNFDPGGSRIEKNGKEKVQTKRIDSLGLSGFDVLVVKIDVEGKEQEVIEGGLRTLKANNSFVVLEDFIKPGIIKFMKKNKFKFIGKLTPYNSWWAYEI